MRYFGRRCWHASSCTGSSGKCSLFGTSTCFRRAYKNLRNELNEWVVHFLTQWTYLGTRAKTGAHSFHLNSILLFQQVQAECFSGDRFSGHAGEQLPPRLLWLRRVPAVDQSEVCAIRGGSPLNVLLTNSPLFCGGGGHNAELSLPSRG